MGCVIFSTTCYIRVVNNNEVKENYEVYKSKYRNVKYVDENGVKWDSKKEYKRYLELKDRENKKEISNIQRQVTYQVMPRLTDENGKFKYHPIKYVADFVYTDNATGKEIVEDAKGIKTEVYKIKKKLMYWQYKIEIKEV